MRLLLDTHAFLWTPIGGMEDITAIAGIPDVHGLNNALQTLSGRADFTHVPEPSPRPCPRLLSSVLRSLTS